MGDDKNEKPLDDDMETGPNFVIRPGYQFNHKAEPRVRGMAWDMDNRELLRPPWLPAHVSTKTKPIPGCPLPRAATVTEANQTAAGSKASNNDPAGTADRGVPARRPGGKAN